MQSFAILQRWIWTVADRHHRIRVNSETLFWTQLRFHNQLPQVQRVWSILSMSNWKLQISPGWHNRLCASSVSQDDGRAVSSWCKWKICIEEQPFSQWLQKYLNWPWQTAECGDFTVRTKMENKRVTTSGEHWIVHLMSEMDCRNYDDPMWGNRIGMDDLTASWEASDQTQTVHSSSEIQPSRL
jgi:hypothetical protein